jgi:signal peptidase I
MSHSVIDKPNSAVFHGERLLAFSNFLKKGTCEFESTVLGGSMGKALPPGSIIRVRFANDANLETGHVVTYVATDRIVAHRLVKMATSRGDRYVITCGDGTVCPDAPMPVSAVIGILTEIRSNGVWRPVPPPHPRSFGFRLMAYLFSRIVLIALWLDPRFSNWVAARIVETRAMAVRGVEVVKHCARRNSPRQPVPRS